MPIRVVALSASMLLCSSVLAADDPTPSKLGDHLRGTTRAALDVAKAKRIQRDELSRGRYAEKERLLEDFVAGKRARRDGELRALAGWARDKRDRLQRRVYKRLDSSKHLDSTTFRRGERKVLKRAVNDILHPVASYKGAKAFIGKHGAKARDSFVWVVQHPKDAAKAAGRGVQRGWQWTKNKKGTVLMWGVGLPAVIVVAMPNGVAVMSAKALTDALAAAGNDPTIARVIGTGAGGALSSFASSLWAHGLPMVNGRDKVNLPRVFQDTFMSAFFGFFGFAVAEWMKSGSDALGLKNGALAAYNFGGLMAYEMFKDYLQNGVNNMNIKVYNYHQANKDKRLSKVLRAMKINGIPDKDGSAKKFSEIWDSTWWMETLTNGPRVLRWKGTPLTTNYAVKAVIDLFARLAWSWILHGDHDGGKKEKKGQPTADLEVFD